MHQGVHQVVHHPPVVTEAATAPQQPRPGRLAPHPRDRAGGVRGGCHRGGPTAALMGFWWGSVGPPGLDTTDRVGVDVATGHCGGRGGSVAAACGGVGGGQMCRHGVGARTNNRRTKAAARERAGREQIPSRRVRPGARHPHRRRAVHRRRRRSDRRPARLAGLRPGAAPVDPGSLPGRGAVAVEVGEEGLGQVLPAVQRYGRLGGDHLGKGVMVVIVGERHERPLA